MVIFTSKYLKFSELSKIRKLIHSSFTEEQKSPFQENINSRSELYRRQKSTISQKIQSNSHSPSHLKSYLSYILFFRSYLLLFCLVYIVLSTLLFFLFFSLLIRNALHPKFQHFKYTSLTSITTPFYPRIEHKLTNR